MGSSRIEQVSLDEVGATPKSENYIAFKWSDGADIVYFTASWRGAAMSCHVGAFNRNSKLKLRVAISEFCEMLFRIYQPEAILALVQKQSIVNLLDKLGFETFLVKKNGSISVNCMILRS